jgi:soluble lytic murein transglycosylase-like protein
MDLPGIDTSLTALTSERIRSDRALADLQGQARREATDGAPVANDLAGLRRIAGQFEALFYNQLISSMRSTVPENQFWGQGSGTKIYQQLQDQALADRLADGGGLGIADLIVRQFQSSIPGSEQQATTVRKPPVDRARVLAAYDGQRFRPGADISRLVRLRRSAESLGGAAADSLDRYQHELMQASRQSGVDPALVLAVMVRESGGDPAAESPRGAQGLMQLMPGTARELGVADPRDPAQNLRGGAEYLARMLNRYDGDVDLALAAYNAGPGTVDRAGRSVPEYAETRDYIQAVKELAQRLGAQFGTVLDTGTPEQVVPEPTQR